MLLIIKTEFWDATWEIRLFHEKYVIHCILNTIIISKSMFYENWYPWEKNNGFKKFCTQKSVKDQKFKEPGGGGV